MATIKELSIEEKAKHFDEAKEKARKLKDEYNDIEGYYPNQWLCEELFPELKEESEESENERIRKDIVFYIAAHHKDDGEKARWLYWLEKQGEKETIGNEKEIPFSEKKPAWSEEDEYYLNSCITKIEIDIQNWEGHGKTMIDGDKDLIAWLKSLKDKIIPQPKQEWGEGDEKMLKDTIRFCELCGNQVSVNWLKSLRPQNRCTYNPYKAVVESIAEMCEKYEDANLDSLKDFYSNVKVKCKDAKEYDSLYPQSQWKPSEEQMEALDDAIDICSKQNNDIGDWLDNLREQLKKLKEA